MAKYCQFLALLLLVGCSSAKLERLARVTSNGSMGDRRITVNASFCAPAPETLIRNRIKFLFLVDRSGSNAGNATVPGTDPTRARRFDSIKQLTQRFQGNDRIEFSLITFSGSAALVAPFTPDATRFSSVLDAESRAATDQGLTNFTDTLDRARLLIGDDVRAERARDTRSLVRYVAFLISDGRPTAGGTTSSAVLDSVTRLTELATANVDVVAEIQLNTVYYFNPPARDDEVSLMRAIAERGNGEARTFSDRVDFSTFDLDETVVQHPFFDAYVTNRNGIWESGSYVWDRDGDGLSDEKEAELESNPALADSDNNGMSDGDEMKTSGRPCRDPACVADRAERFPQCQSFNGPRLDTDLDRLSDCLEARILGSDPANRDTNGDGIPDDLEFRNELSLTAGRSDALNGTDSDGRRYYDAIKFNYPLRFSSSNVSGFVPYDYKIGTASRVADKDCYQLVVSDVAVLGDEPNEIQLDLVFRTSIVMQSQTIRRASKRATEAIIEFKDEDFR